MLQRWRPQSRISKLRAMHWSISIFEDPMRDSLRIMQGTATSFCFCTIADLSARGRAQHAAKVQLTQNVHRPTLLLRHGKALRPGLSSTMASSAQDHRLVPGTQRESSMREDMNETSLSRPFHDRIDYHDKRTNRS